VFQVRVNRLGFKGLHGIFESERVSGNDFVATIVASVDGTADRTDHLDDTVDYSALAGLLLEVSSSSSFRTVEGLCGAFAGQALSRFPSLLSVEVTIDKRSPLGMPDVASCGVRLVRSRQ
jgi:dihydroneopterin aldolase